VKDTVARLVASSLFGVCLALCFSSSTTDVVLHGHPHFHVLFARARSAPRRCAVPLLARANGRAQTRVRGESLRILEVTVRAPLERPRPRSDGAGALLRLPDACEAVLGACRAAVGVAGGGAALYH
jgi:hypothetical protein